MVFKLLGRWVGAGDGQSCLTGWFALGWRLLGREFWSPKHVMREAEPASIRVWFGRLEVVGSGAR